MRCELIASRREAGQVAYHDDVGYGKEQTFEDKLEWIQ